MQALKRWLTRRHTIDRRMAVILIIIFSFFITCAMLALTPIERYILRSLITWSKLMMPLLNWLPVLALMLAMYFLTASAMAAITSVGGVMLLMAVVNRVKLLLRGDPLFHWDFSLIGEVAGIAKGFDTRTILLALVGIVLYVFLAIYLIRRFPTEKMPLRRRAAYSALSLVLLLAGNATVYSSDAVYQSLPVWGSFYNHADVHNSRGNLYSFIYTRNTTRSIKPDGYDAGETRAFAEAYGQAHADAAEGAARPSIIMIMGEAFSDISDSPAISFDGYTDPLAHYKALGQDGIAGRLVVPSRGGGTADTEHDVLTGRAARFMRGTPYAYRTITAPTEALPSLLAATGYDTFALHPGYNWFYNRQNAYEYLGFAEAVFEDAFPREAYDGVYITEAATFDMLLEMIDARVEQPDPAPLFGFCLTIQNHAAYDNRFLPEGTVTFATDLDLTGQETNILSNYFAGIADADAQLKRLTDYLDTLDEPFVLVYYGDHLPSLDERLYELLIPGADAAEGSLTAETRLYTVPFIIWENAAAKETADIASRAKDAAMPQNMTISSNYLGAYLMELLGQESLSPYLRYVNEVRAAAPVLMEALSFGPDGKPIAADDADAQALINRLQCWMYALTKESK